MSEKRTDSWGAIEVRGARENNLRNVSLDIPKRRLTVFTGVSGSGKSSLVFQTIAAESRRLRHEMESAWPRDQIFPLDWYGMWAQDFL